MAQATKIIRISAASIISSNFNTRLIYLMSLFYIVISRKRSKNRRLSIKAVRKYNQGKVKEVIASSRVRMRINESVNRNGFLQKYTRVANISQMQPSSTRTLSTL